ncbi:hypothetical protein [Streptomyces colonosanans]|uniref:Regulatory protein n=1 Tax=Streptomyces colonosanans TaxID=1428652 RepID=A0A1S2PNS2_9ACTN|nr:hypothetical protein [Streptomyces colonosanans]OIJ94574.1 hypothetical protein BIV24_10475 [Streptomyces colonosanans]
MSQNTTATTELTTQYAAQVTSDLERNTKEQDRVSAEIAALQDQLVALQHDHSVLVNVQQVLGASPASVQPVPAPESATVPAPRKKPAAEPGPGKRTRAKKADTAQGRSAAKKPAAKKPAAKKPAAEKPAAKKPAAAKGAKPTLVELVRDHLAEQGEPRSAAEVTTALDTAHPERGIKPTVVRNTLEGLVAKNQAQRTKQGSSVFYAASDAAGQTAASAKGESQSEQGE